ncbi:hypothetical protein SOVF_023990 isoform A [Spinacia oleracea]|nr:hypothetical protein SOVF_023990 isoform A [Spinacia oleracea]
MGRGVSSGGRQSSLCYLFGSGEAPKPAATKAPANICAELVMKEAARPAAVADNPSLLISRRFLLELTVT